MVRRASYEKGIELIRVWVGLIRLRIQGKIDVILYPVGGPHLAPLIRDLLLLPVACLLAKRVVLHFRAAGLAEALPRLNGLLRAAVRTVYRNCGEAIALTEFGRRDPEAAGLPPDRITVIPNACEDRFRPDWKKERQPGDPITFFHAGLLCPDKGTPDLLEAFVAVATRHPNVRLKLAGEPMGGLTEESIHEIASKYGIGDRVEFCGVIQGEALDRAFAEADVFVFSTVAPFESFGMVLIEAMMWGLPIVASDWRANREVLGFDRQSNVIYDVPAGPRSENLEKALEEAVLNENHWNEWGRRNRLRFQENFEIERMKKDFENYFGPRPDERGYHTRM